MEREPRIASPLSTFTCLKVAHWRHNAWSQTRMLIVPRLHVRPRMLQLVLLVALCPDVTNDDRDHGV